MRTIRSSSRLLPGVPASGDAGMPGHPPGMQTPWVPDPSGAVHPPGPGTPLSGGVASQHALRQEPPLWTDTQPVKT